MTYEILDNILTAVLTVMVYGVPAVTLVAFAHFVCTTDVKDLKADKVKPENQVTKKEVDVKPETKLVKKATEKVEIHTPVTNLNLRTEVEVDKLPNTLECAEINPRNWTVTELKKALKPYKVKLYSNGKALKKAELIEAYKTQLMKK